MGCAADPSPKTQSTALDKVIITVSSTSCKASLIFEIKKNALGPPTKFSVPFAKV